MAIDSVFEEGGGAMSEPASAVAAGAAMAWKSGLLGKLVALAGVGAAGAAVMAAFEPPESKRMLFAQGMVAGVFALMFTPGAVRALDASTDLVNMVAGDFEQWAEVALPVGFLLGALSWGAVGALAKLRKLLNDRAADALARRAGLGDGNG